MEKAIYQEQLTGDKKQETRRVTPGRWIMCIFLVVCCLLLVPTLIFAADLSLSPLSGKYSLNQVFPVVIYVSSPDQSINAVSGTISFPKDKLNLVSISKAGSVISIWVQEPTFSNKTGTVSFEGIILNPGFTGLTGNTITLNFKGVSEGTATVRFSTGAILANDGNGTNVLKNLGESTFFIIAAVPAAPQKPSVVKNVASNISEQVSNVVKQPTVLNFGSLVITILVIIICLILIIILCILLILYGWRKFYGLINNLMREIQRLKEVDIMEKRELAGIRQNIKNSNIVFGKNLEQLRKANTIEDSELAKLESKLENKTILFEKDIQQLKEVNALKLEELTKLGVNLKAQMDNKNSLLEKDIQQLKENSTVKEGELSSLRNSIQSLNENYKNIVAGENELKAKIVKMNDSLMNFYHKTTQTSQEDEKKLTE